MAKKKTVEKTKAPDQDGEGVTNTKKPAVFPEAPIARLVQMDGYLQYHFENGVSGSSKDPADMNRLRNRWDAEKQARAASVEE